MNKDHAEKRNILTAQINELKKDLQEIIEQHHEREVEGKEEYVKALDNLANLEKKHVTLTMEFFRFRMDGVEDEQKLQEESEVIRLKNVALLQKLKKLEQSHLSQFSTTEGQVKRKNQEFKKKCKL